MTRPIAVLKSIADNAHDLKVRKDILTVTPTEHILRGITFERTGRKGLYYLWRIILPLYRVRPILSLNYSVRIGSGNFVFDIGGSDLHDAVDEVSKAINESHSLEILRTISTPKDFLKRVVINKGETDRRLFMDIAFSHWLSGEKEECVTILRRAHQIPIQWESEQALSDEIGSALQEFDRNPSLISSRLASWEVRCKLAVLGDQ